jgi:hypothetical protein
MSSNVGIGLVNGDDTKKAANDANDKSVAR